MTIIDTTTPATTKIYPAMVAALATFTEVTRSRTADTGSFSYSYADLADVLAAVRAALHENGLAVVQDVTDGEQPGTVAVSTVIIHVSGESVTFGPLSMVAKGTPQAAGSAITYARRYCLMAALGIATEDDDGKTAEPAKRQTARPAKPAPSGYDRTTRNKRLMALYNDIGYARPARLAHASAVVGRELGSANDLTDDEMEQVIKTLEAEKGEHIIDGGQP